MPLETFQTAICNTQKQLGIARNFGVVFHYRDKILDVDYRAIMSSLLLRYQASNAAMRVRMKELNLLREQAHDESRGGGRGTFSTLSGSPKAQAVIRRRASESHACACWKRTTGCNSLLSGQASVGRTTSLQDCTQVQRSPDRSVARVDRRAAPGKACWRCSI